MKPIFKIIKTVWNALSILVVIIVVVLAMLIAGVRVFGITPLMVLTESMKPNYPAGSMIYIKDMDAKELKKGDPITFSFNEDGDLATHRIVDIRESKDLPGTLEFQTKGDANEHVDGKWINERDVEGKLLFGIPGFGFFADYIQHPPGLYVAIALGGLLILFVFLPDVIFPKKRKSKE